MIRCAWVITWILLTVGTGVACAQQDSISIDPESLRAALKKALPPIEEGAKVSARERKCFTCHNQGLPLLVFSAAKERGFEIDEENRQRQIHHTVDHLKQGQAQFLKGKGQGGQVLSAGYAGWALAASDFPADELTASLTHYLLEYQTGTDHWHHRGKRPPSSGSDFTSTFVALACLESYATEAQAELHTQRKQAISAWVRKTPGKETEDFVFRLRCLQLLQHPEEERQAAQEVLLARQQEDGGWSQNDQLASDPYATGTVVTALLESGLPVEDGRIQQGLKYLLKEQREDGTWYVQTRAVGFQEYYESGFPYEEDQFISISASCWASWALLLAVSR